GSMGAASIGPMLADGRRLANGCSAIGKSGAAAENHGAGDGAGHEAVLREASRSTPARFIVASDKLGTFPKCNRAGRSSWGATVWPLVLQKSSNAHPAQRNM